ncbi:MAG: hypothetical protein GEU75_03730 [Dehalococcoidia bacterium]|nr:hypothetical protein [Dehalococcoidia bacterium]
MDDAVLQSEGGGAAAAALQAFTEKCDLVFPAEERRSVERHIVGGARRRMSRIEAGIEQPLYPPPMEAKLISDCP